MVSGYFSKEGRDVDGCYLTAHLPVCRGTAVFVDDRPLNLESPRRLGFSVIHYQSPEQLRTDLQSLQVEV